ncbi:hypothetical protein HYW72_00510 [Candidatus Nomurabacteria bacterium]|nr:hypothetical protein [Candidatus Nomurabacteria bacterium]
MLCDFFVILPATDLSVFDTDETSAEVLDAVFEEEFTTLAGVDAVFDVAFSAKTKEIG